MSPASRPWWIFAACSAAVAGAMIWVTAAVRELEHDHVLVHGATLGGRSIACVIGARG